MPPLSSLSRACEALAVAYVMEQCEVPLSWWEAMGVMLLLSSLSRACKAQVCCQHSCVCAAGVETHAAASSPLQA